MSNMSAEIRPTYLVMVTTANNNKYYRMIPNGDTWTAEYGRVGESCQKANYPISQWNTKYREKVRKGYSDQTDLALDLIQEVKTSEKPEYKDIENAVIAKIVDRLRSMARESVQKNYTVSSASVTQAMVDEAQEIIDTLGEADDIHDFNRALLNLFTVIPRRMGTVRDYLASSTDDRNKIIVREQNTLDVMRGQVVTRTAAPEQNDSSAEPTSNMTILEKLGIVIEECSDDDINAIKKALGESKSKFKAAWKVTNLKTQKRFDDFVSNEKIQDSRLLFHGSRNENWWSIINSGLVLRPANAVITGKMFGYGLYYAPKAQKSIGYTSLSGSYWAGGHSSSGFMALMNVAYGKPYDVYSFDSKYYNFNYGSLRKTGNYDCLHAHAGSMLRNDEIIVYREEQCTIKYLVEIS